MVAREFMVQKKKKKKWDVKVDNIVFSKLVFKCKFNTRIWLDTKMKL